MPDASVGAIAFVTLLTIMVGARGIRVARTPDDFMVAARQVPPALNAAAISGEYLSAASFLGIAGLVVAQGLGALWYSVGYTAGYLVLLLLVAAPLRRFGAYTIPDFAAGRLGSVGLRQATTVLVLVIGWFYLLPQMKGLADHEAWLVRVLKRWNRRLLDWALWHQRAVFGVSVVSSDAAVCHAVLSQVADAVESIGDAVLTDRATEIVTMGERMYGELDGR